MIRIEGLRKTFYGRGHPVTAVDGVDLTVAEGEVFGVVGRSGAGKSTLLRCVNMLERPDEGRVTVDDVELTALREDRLRRARQGIGMVHQHFALLASRTAADNVSFALEVMGVPRRERAARVAELLDLVGLTDRAGAYPAQLSGGQKQRVGIARALASRPRVLLSDEATSALDPDTTSAILNLLRGLTQQLGLTILLITHEMEVVKRLCDAVAIMREGRFVESGRVDQLLSRPGSQLARDIFPLGPVPTVPGHLLYDITLAGPVGDETFLSDLTRRHDLDVRIVAGAVEQLEAARAGRLRIALPGSAPGLADGLRELRAAGFGVEEAR
ncbi:methionine ABC transporter ATP-binding protein [Micromonospora cathayae]|uniref:ATP-binding cassette domain-containing protein n=1 Tax=Micromonospora cathayae TaxID=3028804 RepID=A0ABY7ZIB3_9ACTN|nr:ATP-binding cassette domain-containing protein [Micromonospora sp. HUAS 3]WDZ82690.1 ATP-binding cassette domain-containing protein [Micromonospora sp. HUAS 3]